MTTDLYNSALTMATRVTIILQARPHLHRTEREIAAIDLLTTNANEFGLYPVNLHGDTIYIASEFAARKKHVSKGLRYAVTHGLITAIKEDTGIHFAISGTGAEFVSKLSSQYTSDYRRALNSVLAYVDSRPVDTVIRRIQNQAIETMKEPQS